MDHIVDAASSEGDALDMYQILQAEQLYCKARAAFAIGGDTVMLMFEARNPELASKSPLIEREYLRFMVLKCLYADIKNPARLIPSEAVHQLWHAHALVSDDACLSSTN